MLFNFPIRDIMPVINRPLVGTNNDDEDHKALIGRQSRKDKGKDTSIGFVSLPIGSTVAVQQEDRGLWTHGTVEAKGNHNHHNRLYKSASPKQEKQSHAEATYKTNTNISRTLSLGPVAQKHQDRSTREKHLRNNHLHPTSSTTQTVDKTVATPHMIVLQCMKKRTITKKEGKKIVNKNHCKQIASQQS